MKTQVLGKTEFLIEKWEGFKGLKSTNERKYIPMFKTGENWFFALPVKSMYLLNIKECKEQIFEMLEIKGMSKEWKIAEF